MRPLKIFKCWSHVPLKPIILFHLTLNLLNDKILNVIVLKVSIFIL